MNKSGIAGGLVVLGMVGYGAYLLFAPAVILGGYSSVMDYQKCMQIVGNTPVSKSKAEAFLKDVDARLNAETAAADTVQGTAAVMEVVVGRINNDSRVSADLKKCIAELKRSIEISDEE